MIYVDTSALVKLVRPEDDSPALEKYLDGHADNGLVSSVLVAIETRRTLLRHDPQLLPRADLLLTRVGLVSISDAIVESASRLPDGSLRSLDAIHLATALLLAGEISVLLSYDQRLCAAAKNHSIETVSPA